MGRHGEEEVRWGEGPHSCKKLVPCHAQTVRDGEDVCNVVERDSGGHTEYSAHLPDGVVLGDLEQACEALLASPGIPKGGAVGEGGDDDGVEYAPPVVIGDTLDRVAEDA